MLKQLSPVVHREARRYCSDCPEVTEDAYQEARIKLWRLLEDGHRERPYLLAATKNCIIDFTRRERRQPRHRAHRPLPRPPRSGRRIGESGQLSNVPLRAARFTCRQQHVPNPANRQSARRRT
jgi:DNA-directed RNA polymerase specialized sigma24 family protein